ncbi:amino acid--tRNA ligase-related protein [Streptosporangium sp. NPDC087985]|uniref:amino acid--tRNA ligase-related protein n=1 Tax=Streptosporangium sp. NPDC087985 TaxID=3366196 RepID=UPI0038153B4D
MIHRILAADLPKHVGHRVRIAGWLHRRRELKSLSFLVIRDRSGLAQVIQRPAPCSHEPVPRTHGPAPQAHETAPYPEETVLEITGTVVANPQAPGGAELADPEIEVLAEAVEPPPFDLYRPTVPATLPTILDHAPVALRHPRLRAPFEIAAAGVTGFRTVLDGLGFTETQTPKIVGTATESGANVFGIDYFGRPAFLAQSPQFFKQALVGVFERVYEVGPVFRAEPHDTARHLAQYTSLDAELGFILDHRDVMAVLTRALAGMHAAAAERAGEALALLEVELPEVPEEIPAIHFADAQELLARHTDYLTALAARGEDPRAYAGYLAAFAHGMPPHGGFAIGLERWTSRLTGAPNVRQTTLFPRDLHRLTP